MINPHAHSDVSLATRNGQYHQNYSSMYPDCTILILKRLVAGKSPKKFVIFSIGLCHYHNKHVSIINNNLINH